LFTIRILIIFDLMADAERKPRYWDHYWQTGQASCCDDRISPSAAEAVESVWRRAFGALPAGARALDLCTGNGAVLEIGTASAPGIVGVGVDAASIRPALQEDGIEFVRAEADKLPLADDSFDIVTSQFGIEYTPVEQSVAEVGRVLAPGGSACLVIHADEGETAIAARAQLRDLDELLDELSIFPAAEHALELVCAAERSPTKPANDVLARAKAAYDRFYARLSLLGETWQQRAAGDVYRDTGSLLQHTFQHRQAFPLDALLAKVRETAASVGFHRQRLAALCDAALDETACRALAASLESDAAPAAVDRVQTDDGDFVAWLVNAGEPGS
jgi:ubiquinone/menaquinone biosynthesis C-methylase UbiE